MPLNLLLKRFKPLQSSNKRIRELVLVTFQRIKHRIHLLIYWLVGNRSTLVLSWKSFQTFFPDGGIYGCSNTCDTKYERRISIKMRNRLEIRDLRSVWHLTTEILQEQYKFILLYFYLRFRQLA
jgi:hypothetical protein